MDTEEICFILHGLKQRFEKIDFVIKSPFDMGSIMNKYRLLFGESINKYMNNYSNDRQSCVYGVFFDRKGDDIYRLFLGKPTHMYEQGVKADVIIDRVEDFENFYIKENKLEPIPLTESDVFEL